MILCSFVLSTALCIITIIRIVVIIALIVVIIIVLIAVLSTCKSIFSRSLLLRKKIILSNFSLLKRSDFEVFIIECLSGEIIRNYINACNAECDAGKKPPADKA